MDITDIEMYAIFILFFALNVFIYIGGIIAIVTLLKSRHKQMSWCEAFQYVYMAFLISIILGLLTSFHTWTEIPQEVITTLTITSLVFALVVSANTFSKQAVFDQKLADLILEIQKFPEDITTGIEQKSQQIGHQLEYIEQTLNELKQQNLSQQDEVSESKPSESCNDDGERGILAN
jgi:hypothetical protein